MIHWNPRQETIDNYLAKCKAAAEIHDEFLFFKRDPYYTSVLEHTSKEIGQSYLNEINEKYPNVFNLEYGKIKENDAWGAPKVYDFGNGVIISPTTLQYFCITMRVCWLMQEVINPNIIEIGGGYGGQCKMIKSLLNAREYSIIDLPEVNLLQSKYLSKFDLYPKLFTNENYPKEKQYDLVISNYALSEIKEPLQEQYIRDICLNSKHGYITCNAPLNTVHLLKEKFTTYKESPDIDGERKENFIITW